MRRASLLFEGAQRAANDFGLCGSTFFRNTRDQPFKSSQQTNAYSHNAPSYDRVGHQRMTKPLELYGGARLLRFRIDGADSSKCG